MRARRKASTGFSLLELLIAIGIFSAGILGVIGTYPLSYTSLDQSKNTLYATRIAQRELEIVKTLPFANLTVANLATPTYNGVETFTSTANGASASKPFTFNTIITWQDQPDPNATTKSVAVLVQWPTRNGVSFIRMETIIAR